MGLARCPDLTAATEDRFPVTPCALIDIKNVMIVTNLDRLGEI